ncbi:DNA polymerase [Operophtera brumata]|uniref:DNA polymerase n=1 Tax=Operophtera brumata TaxID=104452 RepID=A0A0L7KYY4_OPEBR|nr:DNA polymerase [Operophtera brumata]
MDKRKQTKGPPPKRFKSQDDDDDNDNEVPSSFEEQLAGMDTAEDTQVFGEGPENQASNMKWSRPPPPALNPKKDSLVFQQLDIDHYNGQPVQGMPGSQLAPVPIMRMYGVTMDGNSVCCHVHGFTPYFYVTVPVNFTESTCNEMKTSLNRAVLEDMRSNKDSIKEAVLEVRLVKAKSLMYYKGDDDITLARVSVALPKIIAAGKRLIERQPPSFSLMDPSFFESNIDFDIRFMVDTSVVGCSWIELPQGRWSVRSNTSHIRCESRCQIEVDVAWNAFIAHQPEGEWSKVAPFRILSFDIECAGRKGVFPEPNHDPVIQIASMVIRQGETEPYLRNVFTLNTCAPIVGSQVLSFQSESEMLAKWSDFFPMYCLKDAYLPLKLLNKLMCIINYMEMARVTGVPLLCLLTRGQQIKVVSQLLRKAKEAGYLMPAYHGTGSDDQFEGATVIEPKKGYYADPISTLDFASLYPSIMMAHNLCYTTLVPPNMQSKLQITNDDLTTTPTKNMFVKATVRKGLLPEILESLLAARKKAKADLKDEKDPFKRSVLDGRQLALKISANSVYGFTGAQVGKLPCLEISGSVTAYGRTMIEFTKTEVEKKFTKANGYKEDAVVIYGDTDSVMVKFGVKTLEESMELGREAAVFVTDKFVKPIKLEFEKVYYPYLLINKKRYAGLYFTRPDKYDKMDCKGIETVRRDNCQLVSNMMSTCLQKLLIDRDPDGAVNYAKQIISDLLCNRIDISQLVITKELTKNEYAAKQAHVELANKMRKRDAGTAPKLGDRVPYVICCAAKNTPAYMKAEDPIYVLENSIPIDFNYYLENQLSKPLLRIFEPILGEKAESLLLKGEHTRTKAMVTSKVGALAAFTKKTEKCIGCKVVMPKDTKKALCNHCMDKEGQLYITEVFKLRQLQAKFARLWTECQRCQGSLHEEVLCTNRDCTIFYMRKKMGIELDAQEKSISRFGESIW